MWKLGWAHKSNNMVPWVKGTSLRMSEGWYLKNAMTTMQLVSKSTTHIPYSDFWGEYFEDGLKKSRYPVRSHQTQTTLTLLLAEMGWNLTYNRVWMRRFNRMCSLCQICVVYFVRRLSRILMGIHPLTWEAWGASGILIREFWRRAPKEKELVHYVLFQFLTHCNLILIEGLGL